MKQITMYFFMVVLFIFSTLTVFGQANGDYLTNGYVSMTSPAGWLVYSTSFPPGWRGATQPPIGTVAAGNKVTILGGDQCVYNGGNAIWGDLEVYGTLVFSGPQTLEVRGYVLNSGGLISVGGGGGGSTFTIYGTLTNNGNFNMYYSPNTVIKKGGTITGSGGYNISCYDLTIDGNVLSSLYVLVTHSLTINTGSILNTANSISVQADIYNYGEQIGSTPIQLVGSLPSIIYGDGKFSYLLIGKSTPVSLQGNPIITNKIDLYSGIVSTGSYSITIELSAIVQRRYGHVNGNLKKYINAGAIFLKFEVGDATNYAPAQVLFSNVPSSPGYITCSSIAGDHTGIATSGVNPSQSVNRYWSFTNSGVVFDNYSATFTFVNPSDLDAGANPDSFVVKKYDGLNWSPCTVGIKTATTTEATGLTSFSDFQIGEQQTYTISATTNGDGNIDPSGDVIVNYGDDKIFTITPNEGYHTDSVLVDGTNMGVLTEHTFPDVTSDHTIKAYFSINTHLVTIRAFRDIDGNFTTTEDRSPMNTILKVYRDADLLDSTFNTILETTVIGDDEYSVEGWAGDLDNYGIIGNIKNGTPVADTTHVVNLSLTGSENGTVDFIFASRTYQQRFRTFLHGDIVSVDTKSKVPKAVKRSKPDKVEFELEVTDTITAPKTGVHVEFGSAPLASTYTVNNLVQTIPAQVVKKNGVIQTLGVHYVITGAIDSKNKKLDYTFLSGLVQGDIINIHGYVKASKPIKAAYWWLNLSTKNPKDPKFKVLATDPAWILNQPRLSMPTYANLIEEVYTDAGYYPTMSDSFVIGTPHPENPKGYGWVYLKKPADVQKSLRDKNGIHIAGPFLFSKFNDTKPFIKELKPLTPSKQNNILYAELVALKLAIDASATLHTEDGGGLGELIYYNPEDIILDGKTVKEIATLASEAMTARIGDSTNFYNVIHQINNAFDGPIDSVQFAGKTVLKGTNQLIDVPFLHVDPDILIARITPKEYNYTEVPGIFQLSQNYPNPFNPTTTIEFILPEDAIVTLKVYNVLGQEVVTLADKELYTEGQNNVEFDATSLSSGVYFYRFLATGLEQDNAITYSQVKKMVLMK